MKHMNENGSTGMAMIILGASFFMATIVLIIIAPVMGAFVMLTNSLMGNGALVVPAQAVATVAFIIGIFTLTPVIWIIGFAAKGLLLANYQKDFGRGGEI
jgi:hypothetical protein